MKNDSIVYYVCRRVIAKNWLKRVHIIRDTPSRNGDKYSGIFENHYHNYVFHTYFGFDIVYQLNFIICTVIAISPDECGTSSSV